MSDTESYHHERNSRNADEKFDQGLDDHRNQPSSLPVPQPDIPAPTFRKYDRQHVSILGSTNLAEFSGGAFDEDSNFVPQKMPPRKPRAYSVDEGLDPKDQRHLSVQNISFKNNAPVKRKRKLTRSGSNNDNFEADLASPMMRMKTNDTAYSDKSNKERRPSMSSIDSDVISHGSRSSQETEEDVCFPMLREHVRINGIDFDEIDEFINEERDNAETLKQQQQQLGQRLEPFVSTTSRVVHSSQATLKYTPKNILQKTFTRKTYDTGSNKDLLGNEKFQPTSDSSLTDEDFRKMSPGSEEFVTFADKSNASSSLPDRFSFFSTKMEETIHAPDIPSLVDPNQSVRDLFNDGEVTWWLDCSCPTDAEMRVISKAFGLHPLTSEDIRVQESREKVELFKNYYFVCFHTFEPDKESEDYLEPINVYIVVFRDGILTFHFSPVDHGANVRRRVRQLRDYVDVSADWICYAIIDDITDAFIPVITGIEYEADAIEDSVFVAREIDFSSMLQRIGESRRKVMTLMRLLSGKADVIKMFAKRCQDEAFKNIPHQESPQNQHTPNQSSAILGFGHDGSGGISFGPQPGAPPNMMASNQYQFHHQGHITQPRADIALYLGDIQDHVVTMFQNLLAYEKIFSRSHANYLAQLQVESVNSNNKVTAMLSQVTVIGTLLLPLNVITGLFGMNVSVPGQHKSGLAWFFGILGVMVFVVILFFTIARIWLRKLMNNDAEGAQVSSRRSFKSFGLRRPSRAKSVVSFPRYDV